MRGAHQELTLGPALPKRDGAGVGAAGHAASVPTPAGGCQARGLRAHSTKLLWSGATYQREQTQAAGRRREGPERQGPVLAH